MLEELALFGHSTDLSKFIDALVRHIRDMILESNGAEEQ